MARLPGLFVSHGAPPFALVPGQAGPVSAAPGLGRRRRAGRAALARGRRWCCPPHVGDGRVRVRPRPTGEGQPVIRDHRLVQRLATAGGPPRSHGIGAGTASRSVSGDALAELDPVAGAASVAPPDRRGFGHGIEARVLRRLAEHPA